MRRMLFSQVLPSVRSLIRRQTGSKGPIHNRQHDCMELADIFLRESQSRQNIGGGWVFYKSKGGMKSVSNVLTLRDQTSTMGRLTLRDQMSTMKRFTLRSNVHDEMCHTIKCPQWDVSHYAIKRRERNSRRIIFSLQFKQSTTQSQDS